MTVIIEHGGYVAEDQNGEEEEEKQNIEEVQDIMVEEDRNEERENDPGQLSPSQMIGLITKLETNGSVLMYQKRGGKASNKYHYDCFNVRDVEKEDRGIYLDKVDWRFEESKSQKYRENRNRL